MRARALAAPALASLVLVAGLGAVGCVGDAYEPLEPGQCLPDGAGVEGVRDADPEVVPCSQPHRYEVVDVFDLEPPSPAWPGAEVVDDNARQLCARRVVEVLGLDADDLPDGLDQVSVAPTEASWAEGDRSVECLLRRDEVTSSTLVPR